MALQILCFCHFLRTRQLIKRQDASFKRRYAKGRDGGPREGEFILRVCMGGGGGLMCSLSRSEQALEITLEGFCPSTYWRVHSFRKMFVYSCLFMFSFWLFAVCSLSWLWQELVRLQSMLEDERDLLSFALANIFFAYDRAQEGKVLLRCVCN